MSRITNTTLKDGLGQGGRFGHHGRLDEMNRFGMVSPYTLGVSNPVGSEEVIDEIDIAFRVLGCATEVIWLEKF
jgi:hypothetical protein